jgi:Family of unknown function (DUF6283)
VKKIGPPASNPCGSCPYRRDVPSGVWNEEEYEKLPHYDLETFDQPPSVFLCHQQNGRLCAGWTGCHDMDESLAFRFAVMNGAIDPEEIDAILSYTTSSPLFSSGAEAAAHGRAEIDAPGPRAAKTINKLIEREANRREGGDG